MNKAQLIKKMASTTKMTMTQSELLLAAALEVIQMAVASGDEVKLVGFGTFCRTNRKARIGRNPKTGETIEIPKAQLPRFKPGKEFKNLMNQN